LVGEPSDAGRGDHALLEMRGISKRFPGVQALDRVDFRLRAGEIHALLGQNGAGKSTLVKVLTGVHRRDAGEIRLAGRPIRPRSPLEAQALGISTVYQEVNLIPHLSVAENIFLGRQPMRWGRIDWRAMNRQAVAALAPLELCLDVTQPLSGYSLAIQQMVAIARALDIQARVLILDEPTSSLDAPEVARLFAVMRRLKARGLGIIFITHFLDQVYAIADRLTVLRNGKLVGQFETAQLPRLELIARMIGREVGGPAEPGGAIPKTPPAAGQPRLRALGLGRRGAIAPTDVSIRAGEVVGLAGLLGSGRTELARLLFGLDRADCGRIEIDGRRLRLTSPRRAVRAGLGFCPENRQTEGLIPALSVRENILLALQASRGWLRRLSRSAQRRLAEQYIRSLNIATPDMERPVAQLSGGTQQKVILARWLAMQPRVLILDEPTRGIDVGAKAEVEKLIAELRRRGIGILFISSELEEVASNCQRVLVLRDRRPVGELAGAPVALDAILRMIAAQPEHE